MTTNILPTLPNLGDIETKAVLKKTARAHQALAELKENGTYDQITGSYFGTSTTAAAQKAVATTDAKEVMVVEGDDAVEVKEEPAEAATN